MVQKGIKRLNCFTNIKDCIKKRKKKKAKKNPSSDLALDPIVHPTEGPVPIPGLEDAQIQNTNKSPSDITISLEKWEEGYTHVDHLASGGGGHVHLAYHHPTKTFRATKTAYNKDEVENEINLMHALQHPRIVNLLEIGRNSDSVKEVKLALEYCEGGDLRDFRKRWVNEKTQIPERLIWYAFLQLAEGLDWLDQHGIVHRDLKPGNTLVTREPKDGYPQFKISDFGLAWNSNTPKHIVIGTRQWQPHDTEVGTKEADVWAIGAIIYYLIMGKSPTHASNFDDTESNNRLEGQQFQKIEQEVLPIDDMSVLQENNPWGKATGYTKKLRECMEAALEKDSKKRITANDLYKLVKEATERLRFNGTLQPWAYPEPLEKRYPPWSYAKDTSTEQAPTAGDSSSGIW